MQSQIILIVLLIIVVFIVVSTATKSQENFAQVLGALGPYKKELAECISECERQDPNKRMQSNGNINCDKRCYSIISTIARSNKNRENSKIYADYVNPIGDKGDNKTETEECEEICSIAPATHTSYRKCVSMCKCQKEVQSWCSRLWCPYSNDKDCMSNCMRVNLSNCNQVSWNWKQI